MIKNALTFKKDVIVLSVGALITEPSLLRKARQRGIRLYIPSGAVCGVDGVGALSGNMIEVVELTTSKPPAGLSGVRYLNEKKVGIKGLRKPKIVFQGSVTEAVRCFPRNINVAATLFLASGGSENMKVVIRVDPRLKRNVHKVYVRARAATVTIEVENVSSPHNPKTSYLTILSIHHLLEKMVSSLKVGS